MSEPESINPAFLARMKEDLQEEYPAFVQSLERDFQKSIRLNSHKTAAKQLKERLNLTHPSPFCQDAYIVEDSYGLAPEYIQGLLYQQEPSASAVVEAMELEGNEMVLDLCAAPGSKSTQIYSKLGTTGFLVCNEINSKRSRELLSNLERMGAVNFALFNTTPEAMAKEFGEVFDKVLVDAPCSGEGMMKKHAAASAQWSQKLIKECAARQKEILEHAWQCLKPGGELVYSTCTFSREENEENVAWFLAHYPDMKQIDLSLPNEIGRGGYPTKGMDHHKVKRFFPMDPEKGEGHFIARFQKEGRRQIEPKEKKSLKQEKSALLPKQAKAFLDQQQVFFDFYQILSAKEGKKDVSKIYGMDQPFLKTRIKPIRQGVLLGEMIKERFEPAHAFFLSEKAIDIKNKVELDLNEMDLFLHGNQLNKKAGRGYVALSYQNVPFGFGKSDGNRITNKIPKGLRLMEGSHLHDHSK